MHMALVVGMATVRQVQISIEKHISTAKTVTWLEVAHPATSGL